MDDDKQLRARLGVHEFLLEQLWANILLLNPSPLEGLRRFRHELEAISQRYPSDFDAEMMAVSQEMDALLSHFWDKVEERLTAKLAERPRDLSQQGTR
jgi:hypothetical protein